jgi:pimeloyl-ACP methyl ester carboxylesterase
MEPSYHALAPDLIGYGKTAALPAGAVFDLDAEVDALAPLLPCCGEEVHLVGHSYGGVVALHLALANPARVRTLTLIEPVFFAALRYAGEFAAYDRFRRLRDAFTSMLARDRVAAMQLFIDFWAGGGAWEKLGVPQREQMLAVAEKIVLDWHASFAADPGRDALAVLAPRTALMRGDSSPEPMRRLVDALHGLMPGSTREVVPGANHLLPVTHASAMTASILSHLRADAERRRR